MSSARVPSRITTPCPTCGHPMRTVNGNWLRERREAAGLTQRDFGDTIGFTSPYVSDIERNRRACPPGVLRAYKGLRPRR